MSAENIFEDGQLVPTIEDLFPEPVKSETFVAWPYIDNLFDFTRVVGKDNNLGHIPNLKGKKVAVIGAGVGGMCAAYELSKCGVNVEVIEAGSRIGGRCWSQRFTNEDGSLSNVFAELGAMRIPLSQKTFWKYANEFNLKAGLSFPDPGKVRTKFFYDNKSYDWEPGSQAPGPFAKIAKDFEEWVNYLKSLLYKPFSKWQQLPNDKNLKELTRIWQHEFIDKYKDCSFFKAVSDKMQHWTKEDFKAFGALGVGSGGFGSLYPVNMLELARIILMQWEEEQQMFPSGVESLPNSFYTNAVEINGQKQTSLEDRSAVKFNTRVKNILYDEGSNKPIIVLDNDEHCLYDAVIVATTTRAMSYMGLSMPMKNTNSAIMSDDVKAAIRNLHITSSSKMFIRTRTKFWLNKDGSLKNNFPLTLMTDELPRAAYLMDYPETDEGVVVISYTWEDDSNKLQALPVDKRFEICREILYDVCPEWEGYLEPVNNEVLSIDWQNEQDYYGAFKLNYPGQEPDIHAAYFQFMSVLNKKLDKGVYIAGDSNSWSGGWIEGALHTGINAASAVVKRLGGELPPYNSFIQDPDMYCYDLSRKSTQLEKNNAFILT
ncbi:FAD-dependent oxidoreductase [Lentisphaera profundi]|uniref:Tryptophan 2-monooxygenase n=1 Tax=Lentisphaera profundi TaxID=1658616 RepID=A0ABY7VNT2_9BACT|nr:NAD(P)/FAD-dependent oxidoreductase [Lentisphaera profundi]WDE95795.1 FAD-dependent oxidoreductase [Lentisphaera profundi]